MKKRIISLILAIVISLSSMTMLTYTVSAARISSDKHVATGIRGGQTIYIKSNTGWNTELFGNTFRTKVKLSLSTTANDGVYAYFEKVGAAYDIQVDVYKKTGNKWKIYKSGEYNCNYKGVILSQILLPGKGVDYKIVITPEVDGIPGFSKPSDINGFKAEITSYGKIKSVS